MALSWYTWAAAAGVGLGVALLTRKSKASLSPLFPSGVEDPKDLLSTVTPDTRANFITMARRFEQQTGLKLKVRSGRRTCAEQAQQWAIGRTAPGQKVTFAKGCMSWHVLGRAVDADPYDPDTGRVTGGCDVYTTAGELWEAMGGKWGGRFPGFGACGDAGHFQWHPGLSMETLCPDPDDCEAAVAAQGFLGRPERQVEWVEENP